MLVDGLGDVGHRGSLGAPAADDARDYDGGGRRRAHPVGVSSRP